MGDDAANLLWRDAAQPPFQAHGLVKSRQSGRFHRLPDSLIDAVSPEIAVLATHTAGGRIRFATDASAIAVRVKPLYAELAAHMPLTGTTGCDLYLDGVYAATLRPGGADGAMYEGLVQKEPVMREVLLHLPLYNGVECLSIGLAESALVRPAAPYRVQPPVLFYGSSITQGACASRPGNAYTGFLSRWLDADIINLGFSGACKGEPAMAEYIAGLSLRAVVLDYDHNAPDAGHLLRTHAPFFRILRDAQPALPVVMVSRPVAEASPDELERRDIVKATYAQAKARGDEKVWFIDGGTLLGQEDRDACTVDGSHPNDLGFYRMARAMLPVLRQAL